jgi:hypothetical protein
VWEVAAAPLAAPPPTSKQHQHHHPHHQLRVWAACGLQSWVASCGRVQLRAWATGGRGCAHRYNAGWQPDGEGEGGAESQPLREAGPDTWISFVTTPCHEFNVSGGLFFNEK